MDPFELGTLYQSLLRTASKYGDRPAYAVPPMKKRAYHPDGWQLTWSEVLTAVERRKQHDAQAGCGPGHRVAILFEQRPELVFHLFALNALGCSTVPMSPDHRHEERVYQLQHSDRQARAAVTRRIPIGRRELPCQRFRTMQRQRSSLIS